MYHEARIFWLRLRSIFLLKKEPAMRLPEFEPLHSFAKSVKSAIFAHLCTFFFCACLSKMQFETFIQH
ncbi:hypothetical protein CI104_21300 [Citrobacter farmeri]|uniref:Uncharacterized protein n=1 Tax=Citrobacter farmeri TaxID=67824 RepID=A0ACA8DAL9_9ENTR|nr:hypothetical protein CI104_21300 [Citrobacter farmeri]